MKQAEIDPYRWSRFRFLSNAIALGTAVPGKPETRLALSGTCPAARKSLNAVSTQGDQDQSTSW